MQALKLIDDCFHCPLHEDGLFCRLGAESIQALEAIRHQSMFPAGTVLFSEGDEPRGLFVLCQGRVKLSSASKDGKSITLRDAAPGEVLGLSSVVAGRAYPLTASAEEPCQVAFIARGDFLAFLKGHSDVAVRVAEHLSMELHKAWEQTRLLALAPSAASKLAQLLLSWAGPDGAINQRMTQEAIGEHIGASRETVSRMLADFKRQGLISIKGRTMALLDAKRLEP